MSSQSPGIGSALPDMNVNTSAQVLTNNGVTASWEDAASAGLPPQGGNSGKYLTTNGSAASWAAVVGLPDQATHSGEFLTTNGTTASWGAVSASISLGAFGSTPDAKGATFGSGTLTLQPADATHPGAVAAADQTFGGKKTMPGLVSTVGGLFTGVAAAGSTSGVTVGADSDYGVPCVWLGAAMPTYASATLAPVGDGSVVLNASATSIKFHIASAEVATLNSGATSFDLTGLGVTGCIKLKSPDGTTYTATIANGGTWTIS